MTGKINNPDDGRHNNRGGWRGGGRPKGSVSLRGQRGIHQIRAYDDEWELLQLTIKLVREDIDSTRVALKTLEQMVMPKKKEE